MTLNNGREKMEGISTSWHSYPSIFAIGHRYVSDIFQDDVLVEEKVDGSQFSFGKFLGDDGEYLKCRSKGAVLNETCPEKMFLMAVDTAKELFPLLKTGWTYRGEYLAKPKHNTLCYERVPNKNIIIFDINTGEEEYLTYEQKKIECERIGLEIVPIIYQGKINDAQTILSFLNRLSILGGQNIEGVVIKNYARFGQDKKVLMAKYVSEGFKEVHGGEWRKENPTTKDILDTLIAQYRTPARWQKSVQHLKEAGKLEGTTRDIGFLMKECRDDIVKEAESEIKDKLYSWAEGKIMRGVVAGLAEWYKEYLLKESFIDDEKIGDHL